MTFCFVVSVSVTSAASTRVALIMEKAKLTYRLYCFVADNTVLAEAVACMWIIPVCVLIMVINLLMP